MRIILTKGLAWGWLLLAITTIALAVVISTARITLPMISDYRDNIEAQVSRIMQRPVHIGGIGVGWDRLRPVLLLDDVLIRNQEDTRDAFHFERLQLSLQMLRSLREFKPVPRSIYLSGSELAITRTLDGGIVLRGLSGLAPTGSVTAGERLETLGNLALNLRDIRLVWHDQPLQQNWEFNTDELKVVVWRGGLSLEGKLQLPPELGKSIDVVAIVRGDLRDYRLWQGDFYLRSDGMKMDALPALLTREWPAISGGSVSTESWGRWQGLDRLELLGSVGISDFQLVAAQEGDVAKAVLDLKRWSGHYRWENLGANWHLDMHDMQIETANRRWPGVGLSFDFQRQGDAPGRLRGDLDFVSLGDLTQLLAGLPVVPQVLRDGLQTLQPSGEVTSVRFDFDTHTRAPRYRVDAELSQLSWLGRDRIPGLSGLDISVSASEGGGEASLSGPGFSFDYPRWFEHVMDFDRVEGDLTWQRQGKGWDVFLENLSLENPDVRGNGTVKVRVSPDFPKPRMALEMLVPELNMARIAHYLPYGILPDSSEPWLRKAFISGVARDGMVQYEGELKKNALRYDDVLFTARLHAEDAHLHYRDGWPDVTDLQGDITFNNAGFSADIQSGKIAGADVVEGTAGIENFYLSRLKLDATAQGTISQYLAFLQASGLAKDGLSDFLEAVESDGDARLQLGLDIPLTKKIADPLSVDGAVALDGARLALPEQDVSFTDVRGDVTFTKDDVAAKNLRAIFREGPVTSSIITRPNRDVVIDVEGLYSVRQLLPKLDARWMSLAPGESKWRGRVLIPRGSDDRRPELNVDSDLAGVAVQLPDGLGKLAQQSRDFRLRWELGSALPTVDIHFGDQLNIRALVNLENKGFEIERADVVAGGAAARLGGEGIGIRGNLPQLDLQQWAVVVGQLTSGSESEGVDLRQIELDVGILNAFGQSFPNVQVQGYKQSGDWRFQLASDTIAGEVVWPHSWHTGSPIIADLDKLVVARGKANPDVTKAVEFDPAVMPSLKASIRNLTWGQAEFDTARIDASQLDGDWLIQKAEFDSSIMSVQLAGAWLGNGPSPATTRVQFKLEGRNVGQAFQTLEFSTGLGDGKGVVQGDVSWTGSPFDPDFNSLNGHATVDLRDGMLKQVEPGLGRLLGLVNLDKLPKRLALNFTDVALEGLHYDTVSGTGRFENGVLYVDGFGLDSPGAAVSIYGRTFLTSRRYDLNLNVIPKFKSALPLAAGLFVAPQTGFVVYFLDKLAEGLGVDFNESALLAYKISGDWDEPHVERSTATVEDVRENPLFEE